MRKMVLTCLLIVSALMAQAGEYAYLVFTDTEGVTTAFTVTNWTASVDGSALKVTNDEGTVSLELANLQSMQFSNEAQPQGIENVLDGDAPIMVFTILGTKIGSYDSLLQAATDLSQGVYVVSNGKSTVKVTINK